MFIEEEEKKGCGGYFFFAPLKKLAWNVPWVTMKNDHSGCCYIGRFGWSGNSSTTSYTSVQVWHSEECLKNSKKNARKVAAKMCSAHHPDGGYWSGASTSELHSHTSWRRRRRRTDEDPGWKCAVIISIGKENLRLWLTFLEEEWLLHH